MKSIFCCFICLLVSISLFPSVYAEQSESGDAVPTEVSQREELNGALLGTILNRDFLDRLPSSDQISAAFSLFGGITGGGNLHIHGGPINANVFMFDGLEVTDPVTGLYSAVTNPDIVQDIELRTAGFDASYGRALGGFINIVTRSGTNEFHGVFRVHYIDESWHDSSNHYMTFGDNQYFSPALTLEGPLWKDRLWFVASYQQTETSDSVRLLRSYGAVDDESLYRNVDTDRTFRTPFIKLTFQPIDSHRFTFQFSDDLTSYENPGSYDSTPDTIMTIESGKSVYLLKWQWQVSPTMTLDTHLGVSEGTLNSIPKHRSANDPRRASFYDSYYLVAYNNGSDWTEDTRQRNELSAIASYRLEDAWGLHQLKGGLAYQDISSEYFHVLSGGSTYLISQTPVGDPDHPDYFSGNEASRQRLLFPGSSESSQRYTALFVQDEWAVSESLNLSIGLRYESSVFSNDRGNETAPAWKWGWFDHSDYTGPDGSPTHSARMEFDPMIAPRLGVSMDLLDDQTVTVYAHYGRYYNPFDLSIAALFQPFESDNYASAFDEYRGPQWHDMDRDGVPDEDFFFDDSNWQESDRDTPSDANLLDPDIEPEYSDNYLVGVEYALTPHVSVNANLLYNRTSDMIEDVGLFMNDEGDVVWTYRGGITNGKLDPEKDYDPIDGNTYNRHIYWITNARGAVREYRGIEFNGIYHDEMYDVSASYTFSESEAAITDQPPGDSGIAQFSGNYDTWGVSQNLFGETPWSARHYLKLAGSIHRELTDWYEVSLGINGFWRSGYHYSKRMTPPGTFDPDDPSNDPDDRDTWTGRPPYRSYPFYMPEGRGTYELPSVYSLDLSFQNTFDMNAFGSVTLIFDVFNATDFQGDLSRSEIYNPNRPMDFGMANAWVAPRSYRIGLKYAF